MPAPTASFKAASPSELENLLVLLALALALWILGTTINIARSGWVTIPTADDWDRWLTYVTDHYSAYWFFRQHVDHRLVAPKILFAIDHLVFHARGWFLLLCAFSFQALTGFMLWWLAGRAYPQGRTERLVQAAVIVSCLFSGQQWVNFVWPFQVQFPMVYCAAAAALFALWKSTERDWQSGAPWFAASLVMAAIATYSMANGALLWPILILAAFWLKMPRRWTGAMAAGAILIGATYFYHWHKTSAPIQPPASERLPRAVIFGLAHLGSPLSPLANLRDSVSFRLAFAAIPGLVLAIALLAGFVTLWKRRDLFNGARAVLVFYCVYLGSASAAMAYGRSDEDLLESFSPRYLTPSYILWTSMLLAAWPLLMRRMQRTALYGTLCAAVFIGVAVHQQTVLNRVRDWVDVVRLGETAVIDNVTDPDPWRTLFHTPRITMDAIDYLRNNNLAIFTEEWTHWPGMPLSRRFSIDPSPNACQGQFESPMGVPSSLRPGWRVTGWAWDNQGKRAPAYVVLADDSGLVAGVALTQFPLPPSLSALPPQYTASTWNGYVNGLPRSITAYVLEADNRSLCSIGKQTLRRTGTEVPFTSLVTRLSDSPPDIAGAWVPDGYYKGLGGPGVPPVDGPVFGSFPDQATGTIRLGPFYLDGHTDIAIPIVTGPDNHNLSLTVRDAVSKEVFAQLDPPPIRIAWWAWRPELPTGRGITIEIFAEDKGSGWGQWLALGAPHTLKP